MQPSQRIQNIAASPIRKLSPYANTAKAQGKKVYHLNIGQPDIKTPENVIKAIQNFDDEVLAYGPSEGLHPYRDALPAFLRLPAPLQGRAEGPRLLLLLQGAGRYVSTAQAVRLHRAAHLGGRADLRHPTVRIQAKHQLQPEDMKRHAS